MAWCRAVIRLAAGGLCLWLAATAQAQDLEPRAYVNTPVGMNFFIAGHAYFDGDMAFDPAISIADAHYHMNTEVVAYARALDVFGNSGKFDVILPYSRLSGSALQANGQIRYRDVSGYNDPLFRFSVNFFGAPALSLKEFGSYKQDLLMGASLQVSAPLGQYDNTKLVNLGTNRWSFKPQFGISQAWDRWSVEVAPGVTFFTANNDFNRGGTLEQAPLYSLQTHVVHSFDNGVWLALDGTWYSGGRTTINGIEKDNLQSNTRAGLTLAVPVDRHHSVKFYASSGTSTRTGTEFTAYGVAWQYRWGGGL